jgi:hypothetical protein
VPLTTAAADETGQSGLPSFEQELLALVRFMCEHCHASPFTQPRRRNDDVVLADSAAWLSI